MNWSLAARNLLRDRRRSLITAASVFVGVAAILMFIAYIHFIEDAMSRLVIFQDGNGHAQVYRSGGPENLSAFPARYSLTRVDLRSEGRRARHGERAGIRARRGAAAVHRQG